MTFRIFLALTIACLVLSVNPAQRRHLNTAQATVDATFAWNSCCATWEFPAINTGTPSESFAVAFASVGTHTLTFNTALAGILNQVAGIEGTTSPGWGGDENILSVRVWPN